MDLACFYDDPPSVAAERFTRAPSGMRFRNWFVRLGAKYWILVLTEASRPSLSLLVDGTRPHSSPTQARSLEPVLDEHSPRNGIYGSMLWRHGAKRCHLRARRPCVRQTGLLSRVRFAPLALRWGRDLKPGGIVIASREHVLSCRQDLDEFLILHPLYSLYEGEHPFLPEEYIDAASIRLVKAFNPLESEINLYPESRSSVKDRTAKNLWLPSPSLVLGGLVS